MPSIPQPPFYPGALTTPRTIQRWLDINPITQLERAKCYIELPVFNTPTNTYGVNSWDGYSNLVTAFNFEAPNSFSIPCNISQPQKSLPIVYDVRIINVDNGVNQNGFVIGGEGGGSLS